MRTKQITNLIKPNNLLNFKVWSHELAFNINSSEKVQITAYLKYFNHNPEANSAVRGRRHSPTHAHRHKYDENSLGQFLGCNNFIS